MLYEKDGWYVIDAGKWYEVYKPETTHAVRVACIGKNYGLERCIAEIEKRGQST